VLYTLHVARVSTYKHWSCHVIWFCCCSYTGIRNQHNLSPSVFDISTQFRRYLIYLGNSICFIIPCWCRIHCTSLGLVHINTGPAMSYDFTVVHIQVWVINITYLRRYLTYLGNSMCLIIPFLVPYTLHVTRISLYKHWACHVIWFCCCSYTGIRNQHNVSPSLFDIIT
jgi:hypothetical protein